MDQCQFTSCSHVCEKGCAVLAALERGEIHPSRHNSYVAVSYTHLTLSGDELEGAKQVLSAAAMTYVASTLTALLSLLRLLLVFGRRRD